MCMWLAREFVVAIISRWMIEAANHTCGPYDLGVDEMQLAGFTPEPSVKVLTPAHRSAGTDAVGPELREGLALLK
jgi:flavin reductase (DIM6/NTAB) family NADH-FMN oxidoreductase RutF